MRYKCNGFSLKSIIIGSALIGFMVGWISYATLSPDPFHNGGQLFWNSAIIGFGWLMIWQTFEEARYRNWGRKHW